ncbi:MAG: alcohol dehydrogenase catalytic domain-containing protein, partial [Pseudomonadota bacterium]
MTTMRVIEVAEPGGPEAMRLAERPVPVPAAGEVLVKAISAGVNGPDLKQRKGAYPPPPGASDLMGLEVSGTVAAVGAGVERWREGDAVVALTNGGAYAEY